MRQFFYTYVLRSLVDNKLYIGWTPDLKARLCKHNMGLVESTKSRCPFELLYYEAFSNKKDSLFREKYFKSGWGRNHLEKALKYTLSETR